MFYSFRIPEILCLSFYSHLNYFDRNQIYNRVPIIARVVDVNMNVYFYEVVDFFTHAQNLTVWFNNHYNGFGKEECKIGLHNVVQIEVDPDTDEINEDDKENANRVIVNGHNGYLN